MNVYTLLGAAVADEEFSELLFDDPLKAARSLGVVLTNTELRVLTAFLTPGLEEVFEAAHKKGCPTPPCPLAIARQCDPVSVTSAAD